MDLSQYSNEELMKIAGGGQVKQPEPADFSALSNEELFQAAGIEPTESSVGLKTMADKILPTFITGATPAPGERTLLGNVVDRPGAAVRQGIRNAVKGESFMQGFRKGSLNPEEVPTFLEQSQEKQYGRPDQPIRTFAKGLAADIGAFAFDTVTNPADLLVDTLFFGIGKGAKAAKTAGEAIEQAGKLSKADKAFTKAVRPSVTGRRTASQVKQAKANARIAVDSIVRNKQGLKFVNEAGEAVTGQLPKSLDEFSQAISQTKKEVFKKYSEMQRQAGKEMRVVFVDDIAKELRKSVDSAAINDFAPQAKKAALELADNLDKRGFYSVDEANDVLETLNQQLSAFYKNPDPKMANTNTVNALVANKMRTKLDNVINQETLGKAGKEAQKSFKALKQRYGALKSIESDVNRRLVVDARKNVRGLIDFTDIYTGQQLAQGLLTQNPVALAKGAASYGAKKAIKFFNNPDRQISRMFRQVDNQVRGVASTGKQLKRSMPFISRNITRMGENMDPQSALRDSVNSSR